MGLGGALRKWPQNSGDKDGLGAHFAVTVLCCAYFLSCCE